MIKNLILLTQNHDKFDNNKENNDRLHITLELNNFLIHKQYSIRDRESPDRRLPGDGLPTLSQRAWNCWLHPSHHWGAFHPVLENNQGCLPANQKR